MTAIIDHGKFVKTFADVDAYMVNSATGIVELYNTDKVKKVVDTNKHKIVLKKNGIAWGVIKYGRFL